MLPTFQRILVPVDFSPSSKSAVACALSLAERYQATVHLLHTWELPVPLRPDLMVGSGNVQASLEEHARLESERCMREFLFDMELTARKGISSEVREGTAQSVILGTAEAKQIDLIVMGTHGRTGLSRLMLGSVAEKVVRYAGCPVLTVHAPAQDPG